MKEPIQKDKIVKDFYESLGIAKPKNPKVRAVLDDELLYQLFKKPQHETRAFAPKIATMEGGEIIQADLLALPDDDGYKYALVVADCGNCAVDAEPLKNKEAKTTLKAFEKIFKRGLVAKPKYEIQVDQGGEFKGEVKKYFKSNKIIIRTGQTGRSRQQALAEGYNGIIGRALMMRMAAQELETNEVSKEWTEFLPKVVKAMNEKYKLDAPRPTTKTDIRCKGDNCNIFDVGTKVRVALDEPRNVYGEKDIGGFRAGDIRWDKTPREVTQFYLVPNQPPFYSVSDKQNVWYTKPQLQVVRAVENKPPMAVTQKYVIEKLLERKKENGKIFFLVKWKHKPEPFWEPRANLIKDVPHLVKAFEAKTT